MRNHMLRLACSFALFVVVLFSPLCISVSAEASNASLPLLQDTDRAAEFFALMEENGIVVVNKDFEKDTSQTDTGKAMVSCDYTPTTGIDYSFTYSDGIITSYILTADLADSYAESKYGTAMMCFLMSHLDYTSADSLSVLEYLIDTTENDPIFGAVSELERDGFQIKLNITPVDTIFLIVYPDDTLSANEK